MKDRLLRVGCGSVALLLTVAAICFAVSAPIVVTLEPDELHLVGRWRRLVLWRVDVIAESESQLGLPMEQDPSERGAARRIKRFTVDGDIVTVSFGRHSGALVDRRTGRVTYEGSD